jgi:mRNA-degrading endonuclease RelE of RelBE toxin-antitoxin system/antitoxin (DNA-binding transcriptional repressor) of toxin-antitoxin stability system
VAGAGQPPSHPTKEGDRVGNTYQKDGRRAQPDPLPGAVAVPEQVIVSMAEITGVAKEGLLALVCDAAPQTKYRVTQVLSTRQILLAPRRPGVSACLRSARRQAGRTVSPLACRSPCPGRPRRRQGGPARSSGAATDACAAALAEARDDLRARVERAERDLDTARAELDRLRGGRRPWPSGPEHQPVTAATPSGGTHLWYQAPAGGLRQVLSNPQGGYRVAWQVDLKAGWSYGIAPGATTKTGSYRAVTIRAEDEPCWAEVVRRAEHGESVLVIAHGDHVADVVPSGEVDRLREAIEVLSNTELVRDLREGLADAHGGRVFFAEQIAADLAARRPSSAGKLPLPAAIALYEHLTGPVAREPYRLGKPLDAPFDEVRSARRREYRALYAVDDRQRVVTVLAVAHRRDAYRPR